MMLAEKQWEGSVKDSLTSCVSFQAGAWVCSSSSFQINMSSYATLCKTRKKLSPPKPAHVEPAKHEQGCWLSAASPT